MAKLKPFLASCMKLNHDLNNPLAGIIGYAEIMLSDPGQMTSDQIVMLNKVMTCAERINKHLKELSCEKASLGDPNDVDALIEGFFSRPVS